jgi:TRAP-type C4-dicarboxylate transport system substrate-binding protein
MSWADAQPALASGAVDGQENPLTIFTAAKLHTVGQKNVTLWGYVADPLIFVVSKRVWDSWSKEDQKIVRDAAVEAGRYCIELARDGMTGATPAVHKTIEGFGVKIVRLAPEERAAFQKATRPVYEKWAKQIGPDLVKKAESSVQARKK